MNKEKLLHRPTGLRSTPAGTVAVASYAIEERVAMVASDLASCLPNLEIGGVLMASGIGGGIGAAHVVMTMARCTVNLASDVFVGSNVINQQIHDASDLMTLPGLLAAVIAVLSGHPERAREAAKVANLSFELQKLAKEIAENAPTYGVEAAEWAKSLLETLDRLEQQAQQNQQNQRIKQERERQRNAMPTGPERKTDDPRSIPRPGGPERETYYA